jgi:hypothetical protein
MYEVHPNLADQWVLYRTEDGSFDVVAWFINRSDAELARQMFEERSDSLESDAAQTVLA